MLVKLQANHSKCIRDVARSGRCVCLGLGQSAPSGAGPAVGIFPNREHGASQQTQQSSYQTAPGQQTVHHSYEAVQATPGQQTYTTGHAQQTYPSGM